MPHNQGGDVRRQPNDLRNDWAAWMHVACPAARDQLLHHYFLELVEPIARAQHRQLPPSVELGDLEQAGLSRFARRVAAVRQPSLRRFPSLRQAAYSRINPRLASPGRSALQGRPRGCPKSTNHRRPIPNPIWIRTGRRSAGSIDRAQSRSNLPCADLVHPGGRRGPQCDGGQRARTRRLPPPRRNSFRDTQ